MSGPYLAAGAIISDDGLYRYSLRRVWDWSLSEVVFVMLNPSTADATQDDPTIRRCVSFARAWKFGKLQVVNLYAYRATSPAELARARDPFGPLNDQYLSEVADASTIAAWGAGKWALTGFERAMQLLGDLHCLGVTAEGFPRHPLYLPSGLQPQPYRPPALLFAAAARHRQRLVAVR